MGRYNNILVAFDGSGDGLKALDAAETLAQDNDAQLTVAYVQGARHDYPVGIGKTQAGDNFMFQYPIASGSVVSNMPIMPEEEHEVVIEEEMPSKVIDTAKTKLSGLKKVTYQKLVGRPAIQIVKYANNNNVDLIIIGNRGIGAFKKLVMGSVSEEISNDSKCSVLIVK